MSVDLERLNVLMSVAGSYSTIAGLLATPSETDRIAELRSGEPLDFLAEYLEVLAVQGGEPIEEMRSILADGSVEDVSKRLNIEATRLFHVHVPEPPAIPYESVWREPERLAMGRAAVAVAGIYRENGVYPSDGYFDASPDHIARELEFVAITARREADAVQSGDSNAMSQWAAVREEFLSQHLRTWAPEFCDAIVTDGASRFYSAVATVLIGLLAVDSS